MTPTDNEIIELEAAALVALVERSFPTDIQELLVRGNSACGIAPGALRAAIKAAEPLITRRAEEAVLRALFKRIDSNEHGMNITEHFRPGVKLFVLDFAEKAYGLTLEGEADVGTDLTTLLERVEFTWVICPECNGRGLSRQDDDGLHQCTTCLGEALIKRPLIEKDTEAGNEGLCSL